MYAELDPNIPFIQNELCVRLTGRSSNRCHIWAALDGGSNCHGSRLPSSCPFQWLGQKSLVVVLVLPSASSGVVYLPVLIDSRSSISGSVSRQP